MPHVPHGRRFALVTHRWIRALAIIFIFCPSGPAIAAGDFAAQTLDGEAVRLSDFFEPHKLTLVMIWTTYCTVCAEQFPILESLHQQYHGSELKVVAVAVDGSGASATVRAELQQRRATFDSLISEIAHVSASLELATGKPFSGTPTYLLFNQAGELAGHISGPLHREAIEHYIAEQRS
jgi:thiol-disulfide isomerase/thioredoxin